MASTCPKLRRRVSRNFGSRTLIAVPTPGESSPESGAEPGRPPGPRRARLSGTVDPVSDKFATSSVRRRRRRRRRPGQDRTGPGPSLRDCPVTISDFRLRSYDVTVPGGHGATVARVVAAP
eukprot:12240-Hanusia_phi.AAC.1